MTSVERPGRGVHRGGQPRGSGPEHHNVEGLLIDLGAQPELIRNLRDGRAPQDVVGADEDRALVGADSQPVQQCLALVVAVDVVPAERNQIALEQFADGEGVP